MLGMNLTFGTRKSVKKPVVDQVSAPFGMESKGMSDIGVGKRTGNVLNIILIITSGCLCLAAASTISFRQAHCPCKPIQLTVYSVRL